jgi:hypothetical protein
MKKLILGAAAITLATLTAGVASAQPYGYSRGGYGYSNSYGYGYDNRYARDSDRDGVPDRAEWNRDRDRDGRPDQYDRYDNRRDRHHHARRHHDRYDRYSYGRSYGYRGW